MLFFRPQTLGCTLVIITYLCTANVFAQEQRVWTSEDGKTLTGVLVDVEVDSRGEFSKIKVLCEGIGRREIPMNRLSPSDKEYVDAHAWISSEGRLTVGALTEVIRTASNEIAGAEIQLLSGRRLKVPLAQLSPHDQEFLQNAKVLDPEWKIPRKHSLVEEFNRLGVGVKDQGRRGSCTVFGSLAVIEYHLARKGSVVRLSEQFAAWATTEVMGHRTTSGYSSWDLIQGIREYGITTEELMPYSTRRVGRPSDEALADAATRKNIGTLIFAEDPQLDGISTDIIRAVCGSISEGWPVTTAVGWRRGDLDKSNMLEERGVSERRGHVIVLVGYELDERFPGGGRFTFRNSWGTAYGENGYAFASFQYLQKYGGRAFAIRLF